MADKKGLEIFDAANVMAAHIEVLKWRCHVTHQELLEAKHHTNLASVHVLLDYAELTEQVASQLQDKINELRHKLADLIDGKVNEGGKA